MILEKKRGYLLFLLGMFLFLDSCKLFYPNQMFKQKDYQFMELANKKLEEYLVEPGDLLSLKVYSRDGFKLVDVLGGNINPKVESDDRNADRNNNPINTTYLVDNEGFAKLPIVGNMYVKGFTQNELRDMLAQKYAALFLNPYVIINVENRRVFVFKGGMGTVVPLNASPTSLIEVMAKAGGLDRELKAYRIKIIRGDLKNPQVSLVDLSTLEGVRTANLTMQPNDIVYVESRKRILRDVMQEITPVLTILSLLTTTITLSKVLGK